MTELENLREQRCDQIVLKPDLITMNEDGQFCLEWFGATKGRVTLWLNTRERSDPILLLADGVDVEDSEAVFTELQKALAGIGRDQ